MTLNDWIMAAICAIVSLLVLIGCIVDLCYLHKKERKMKNELDKRKG